MKNVELPFVRDMFDAIAPRYDFLNRVLSLRQDVVWRRRMVSSLLSRDRSKILDVACGTGDVILEIRRRMETPAVVFGLDFSPGMLIRAREKLPADSPLIAGNAFDLPFPDGCFDAVTIAFGIRNIQDKTRALTEFFRGLKPGGTLLVLELTPPEPGLLLRGYLFYFSHILPLIGRVISKNRMAYRYLPESVGKFPQAQLFAALMADAGFSRVRWRKMTLGIATLFVGEKPMNHISRG